MTSTVPNKLLLNNNMFSGNGQSDLTARRRGEQHRQRIQPRAARAPRPRTRSANLGNYTGYPAFVAPRDPRPGSDGPATFLLDANFGLSGTSAAINNALDSAAPNTDFLGNPANPNPTTAGFHLPGFGPRDVGAFEFEPLGTPGTTAVGGAFRVVTTSLVPNGQEFANGSYAPRLPAPNTVVVNFSNPVDKATVKATDLVLSGTDINPLNPVKAMSMTWLDNHTAQFNLTGQFNPLGRSTSCSGPARSRI